MGDTQIASVSAEDVATRLRLQRHPEGGWFRETWRKPPSGGEARGGGTAILFLLAAGERSRWHRVDATELWLFHAGAGLRLFTAVDGGSTVVERRLGADVMSGEAPQLEVQASEWQSAEVAGGWCLVSCIVVPAFEFSGFQMADEGWSPCSGS